MNAPGSIWHEETWPDGWTVRHVDETGSTNADLLAALESGSVADRTALVADHQTAGRGRLDRTWEAPRGTGLLVSLGFTDLPSKPAQLTQRVGLAVVDAVRTLDPAAVVQLKWPNDVLLDGAKLAGILAQRASSGTGVVVGLGLNIGWAPPGAARLGVDATPAAVLAVVLGCLDALAADSTVRYRAELATIGADITVDLPGGRTLAGHATDVDDLGRLVVVDTAGVIHRLDVGDVVHARMGRPVPP